jgi:hypothetical protein
MLPDTSCLPEGDQDSWSTQRRKLLAVMATWRPLYDEIFMEWRDEDWDKAGRIEKAKTARALAKPFLEAWRAAAGEDTTHRYIHDLFRHIPQQIARFGYLPAFSAQGNEHNHSHKKRIIRNCTNRNMGTAKNHKTKSPVSAQVMRHQAVQRALMAGSGAGARDIQRMKTPMLKRKVRGVTGK